MQVWPTTRIRIHLALALLLGAAGLGFGVTTLASWPIGLALGLGIAGSSAWWGIGRYLRRRRLTATPFPADWRRLLERRVDFYRQLDDPGRERFETDVRIFLAEQRIYAVHAEGEQAPVDDEVRLLIASSAATLGHGLPEFEWPRLRDIVVYPRSFDEDYRQGGENPNIAGMVHAQGPILYSAKDLRLGFRRHDGHNVGIHELAHVLDLADGRADGVPVGAAWSSSAPWLEVVSDRLKKLRAARARSGRTSLREYAGTNEAEFFAVAVEAFFERSRQLRDSDPELYAMLRDYFGQDPAARAHVRGPTEFR
ncbi:zinc-dependent peptidase [Nannocystaceae bacterium ST9]